VTVAVLAVIAVVSAFFWPVWTGRPIPFWLWRLHVWLPSWV
jgi:dolichyl-phosphate-mannose-protein mannosyltransferase